MPNTLQELCVNEVAVAFEKSTLQNVPQAYHTRIVDLLPLDLPLELAGQAIKMESYWRQRSQARWTNCDPLKHGSSFKQLYFERNLQDTLEECVPPLPERLHGSQGRSIIALHRINMITTHRYTLHQSLCSTQIQPWSELSVFFLSKLKTLFTVPESRVVCQALAVLG